MRVRVGIVCVAVMACVLSVHGVTVEIAVQTDDDDAHSDNNGWTLTTHGSLPMGPNDAGMRFSLDVPQGATITEAHVTGTSANSTTGDVLSTFVCAQKHDNPPAFLDATVNNLRERIWSSPGDQTGYIATDAQVTWEISSDWAYATEYQTPDISTVVQEIVNRPGWVSGNHIVILIPREAYSVEYLATPTREWQTFDNTGGNPPPLLHVEYTAGSPDTAPAFTTHPATQAKTVGESVTFTASATGTPTPTYQWQKGGSNISGATSASYTIASVVTDDAGSFTCVATNTVSSVTSNAATLTVNAAETAPVFGTHPTTQTKTVGESVTFTASATGTPTPTYQWQKGGSNIAGATSASYTIASVVAGDAGSYTCVATNTVSSVTSNAATLTVNYTPIITTQPASATRTVGQSVTFTVVADGNPAPGYTWRKDGTNISGGTSASYTIASVVDGDAGDYDCIVTNIEGSVTSSTATLTVSAAPAAPTITTQPLDAAKTVGESVTFDITADGNPTPAYQWQKDGSDIVGATSASYTIPSVVTGDAGSYTCVATNSEGSVTSDAAALTVGVASAPPTITVHPQPLSVEVGGAASFSVTATANPAVSGYQWYFDGNEVPAATNATLLIPTVAFGDSGTYMVQVTNSEGSVGSDGALLTVTCTTPTISAHPENTTVDENTQATFGVTATGTATLTYNWQRNDGNGWTTVGATNPYSDTVPSEWDGSQFRCIVDNPCGSPATSNTATLTVNDNTAPVAGATALTLSPGVTTMGVRWDTPESSSSDIDSVWVFYSTAGYPQFGDPAKDTLCGLPATTATGQVDTMALALSAERRYYFSLWLVDSSGNSAAADSAQATTSAFGSPINPVTVSGEYVSGTQVRLTLSNFTDLPVDRGPLNNLPYVDTVGVWYDNTGYPQVPDISLPNCVKYSLLDLREAGMSFASTVTLPALTTPPDSFYYFSASLQWHNPDSLLAFKQSNGTRVLMVDLRAPENPCSISGSYSPVAPYTAATVHVDSTHQIDIDLVDLVRIRCSFVSGAGAPYLLDTTLLAAAVVGESTAGRYSLVFADGRFAGVIDTVFCSVVLVSDAGVLSETSESQFAVGRAVPDNQLALNAGALSSSTIEVAWGPVAGIDGIRILYDTDPIPLEAVDETGFAGVLRPSLSTNKDTAAGLNALTEYHFGAQVNVDGLWSAVTTQSSARATTLDVDPGRVIVNSIVIEHMLFDTFVNDIGIVWRYDTNIDDAEYGIVVSLDSVAGYSATPGAWSGAGEIPETSWVSLGDSVVFDATYYVFMQMRRENGPAALPVSSSTDTLRTPGFTRQSVSYFSGPSDTVAAAGGGVRLWPFGELWVGGTVDDTIVLFTPAAEALKGFMVLSTGVEFRRRVSSPRFHLGLEYGVVPAGYTAGDIRMYQWDEVSGRWLIHGGAVVDEVSGVVHVVANPGQGDLDYPFILMIDTLAPQVEVLSDTLLIVSGGSAIVDTFVVNDNVSNLTVAFYHAKGGDALMRDDPVTLVSVPDTLERIVLSRWVTDDNGVRIMLVVSDGRHADTTNVSRRVLRLATTVSTEAKQWVPLHVTANLVDKRIQPLLQQILEDGVAWNYDVTRFRLFRWIEGVETGNPLSHWVEYSDADSSQFRLEPGRLMWLKTERLEHLGMNAGVTLSLKETRSVELQPGWTDFALPYRFSMRIGDIIDATGALGDSLQFYHWDRPGDSPGYTTEPLYIAGIPGSSITDRTATLGSDPGDGYCVYNPFAAPVTLQIPPTPVAFSTVTAKALSKGAGSGGWVLEVAGKTLGGRRMGPVMVGYGPGGGAVSYYPRAPSFGHVSVGVYERGERRTWGHAIAHGEQAGGFAYDLVFRNMSSTTQAANYAIAGMNGLPDSMLVRVVDPVSGAGADATGTLSVTVDAGSDVHRLVLVGGPGFHKEFMGRLAVPFQLLGVYPNPFRRSVAIRFTVPWAETGRVACALYDASGRRVWHRHLSGGIGEGEHTLVWQGETSNGGVASSGVYVLRLSAVDEKGRHTRAFERRLMYLPW